MSDEAYPHRDMRLLILAPTAKDARTAERIFTSVGIPHYVCRDLAEVCSEAEKGAGAAIVPEEAILGDRERALPRLLKNQPPWSDLPLIVLTPPQNDSAAAAQILDSIGHMTLMKRPIELRTLVSTVRSALRDRQRQYATHEYLVERERQAEVLREMRDRMAFALDAAQLGSWELDLRTGEMECSDICRATLGLAADARLSQQALLDAIHPEDRERVKQAIGDCLDSGRDYDIEHRVLAPDGTTRWIMVRGRAFYDAADSPARMAGISLDITARKRGEERLRQSEGQFRALAETIPQLAWMARPDGSITWYNRRWYEYTGTTPDQMEGWGWQAVHDPAVLPRVLERWNRSLETGLPFDMTFPLRRADGQFRHFLTRVLPFRDDQGRIALWFGTNTDVTERMEMEEALKDNDRRKDEFLAMLAHELRNPLSAISNAVQVSKKTDSKEHIEWAREVAEHQIRHLARMIDDLLDVSRINSGKIQLRRQVLDLAPVIRSAVETVRPLVEDRKHTLNVVLESVPMRVDGDPTRLEQIVVNLLNNAAKYTESGGRIDLSCRVEGEEIVLGVVDTGIGMLPDLVSRAFDLFAQGDRSIARSEGGLGIGLTLVKRLLEMHGGSITAQSDGPGKGSRFTVRLPVARTSVLSHDQAKTPQTIRPFGGSRVLVVDDNVDTAKGMFRLLQLLGHDVRIVYDGPAALAEARRHRPEVILLDIGLPGMDGYEVARTLRNEGFDDTIIIAVSGYGEEQALNRSRESGFNHHLIKPVDFDSLISLIGGPR